MTPWKLIHNGTDLILKQATTVIPNTATWKTLKEAIEASSVEDGDEFLVQSTITATSETGDHGAISVKKKITVKGAGSTSVLDASSLSRIFTVESGGKLTLENLTLKNGKADGTQDADKCGGGILVKEGCEAKLKNCTVKACEAAEKGGAIYSEGELTLDNSTIGGASASDGNKAKSGGGIYLAKGTLDILAGSTIQHNKATDTSGSGLGGGGIYIQEGTLTLSGTVSDNEALYIANALLSGGGVYVAYGEFIMKTGAKISGNKAKWGGGVYIHADRYVGAGSFTMEGGEISGCMAGGSGFTDAAGGGVYIKAEGAEHGTFTMRGGSITGCSAEGTSPTGGGVYAKSGAVFKMSGGAVITPSTQTNTATKSFNDVYLNGMSQNNAKITVDGTLSPMGGIAARITPNNYADNKQVLTGGTVGSNYTKFAVTPDVKEDGIAQTWTIDSTGKLEKSIMEVRYDKLQYYLTTSPHAVMEDGIYRFKITGTIPPDDLKSKYFEHMGKLAQTIQNAGKKVALELPDSIPGLTTMYQCFYKCEYLVSLEKIPSSVTSMQECFKGCKNLTKAPVIPSSVTDMEHCFDGCTALTQAPTIHPGVTNIKWCFQDCKALIRAPVIPQGVTDIYSCFQGCTRLTQVPNIPSSVTNMGQCFKYCAALTQGPDIPSNVDNMYECFEGCTNLIGVKLMCNYNDEYTRFTRVFENCSKLQAGGIKVPPGLPLTDYQDHANKMGTTADKFSGF